MVYKFFNDQFGWFLALVRIIPCIEDKISLVLEVIFHVWEMSVEFLMTLYAPFA